MSTIKIIIEIDEEKGICTAKVLRYVDINEETGSATIFDNPKEELLGETYLELFKGNNYVYIKEYTDWLMKATYIFNNELNKYYAPRVESNSKIRQTADEISLEVSRKAGKDEIVSLINLSPEEIKIKSEKLALEGLTTINGGFSIDEKGNASIANETVIINEKGIQLADGASLIGGQGLITNLQFFGKSSHVFGNSFMNNEGNYDTVGFEVDELTRGENVPIVMTITPDIPENFTIISASVTLKHIPLKLHMENKQGWGYARKIKMYHKSTNNTYKDYNVYGGTLPIQDFGSEIESAFGTDSYTPSIPNDNIQKLDIIKSIDVSEYLSSKEKKDLLIMSSDTPPDYIGDGKTDYENCAYKTGMIMATLNIFGYLRVG